MPELPEVEFARRVIANALAKATITRVKVIDARILGTRMKKPAAVAKALEGKRVHKIERRGKQLRIVLDDVSAFSHLGMSGKWIRVDVNAPEMRFEKLRIDAKQGRSLRSLRYVDPRLLGRFTVSAENIPTWEKLGPDPLNDGIDVDALFEKLSRRKLAIKPALLDQALLAGVGNIQATEALFYARIDPRRLANDLTRKETAALAKGIDRSIRETLNLQKGGRITYVEEANAENPFKIYGRKGEPCPRCKTPLSKIVLAGRGTVFCKKCQS